MAEQTSPENAYATLSSPSFQSTGSLRIPPALWNAMKPQLQEEINKLRNELRKNEPNRNKPSANYTKPNHPASNVQMPPPQYPSVAPHRVNVADMQALCMFVEPWQELQM